MEDKQICAMVRDLMPLYADGLTSKETNEMMQSHLENCTACREMYSRISKKLELEQQAEEVNYMKKVRRRNAMRVGMGVLGAVAAVVLVLFFKLYWIGFETTEYSLNYVYAFDDTVRFGGALDNKKLAYCGFKIKESGDVEIYAVRRSPWKTAFVFNEEIPKTDFKEAIHIDGITAQQNGKIIGKRANKLFEAKHLYVGDMSANGALAGALGVGEGLGAYKNELLTDAEPYVWIFKFENHFANAALFEEKMNAYACVLLALVENLGEVRAESTRLTANGTESITSVYTAEDCSKFVGADIKSFAKSPEKVQDLLDILLINE